MQYYSYTPDKAAAIAFATIFAILGFIFALQIIYVGRGTNDYFVSRQYKKIQLLGSYLPLLVGCILEVIGYAARTYNPDALIAYIIQSIFILIAPAFYAATFYMLFGRITHLLFAEKLLIMPAKYNTLIFVLGDVASLFLQAAGGGLMANQDSTKMGSHIVIGGLFVQIGFFGLFIINEFLFLMRIHMISSKFAMTTKTAVLLNNLLLLGSVLILIRSIVRAVEFIEGPNGTIMRNEWFLYVFDATPMTLTSLIVAISMPWCNIFRIQQESAEVQRDWNNDCLPLQTISVDIDTDKGNDFDDDRSYFS